MMLSKEISGLVLGLVLGFTVPAVWAQTLRPSAIRGVSYCPFSEEYEPGEFCEECVFPDVRLAFLEEVQFFPGSEGRAPLLRIQAYFRRLIIWNRLTLEDDDADFAASWISPQAELRRMVASRSHHYAEQNLDHLLFSIPTFDAGLENRDLNALRNRVLALERVWQSRGNARWSFLADVRQGACESLVEFNIPLRLNKRGIVLGNVRVDYDAQGITAIALVGPSFYTDQEQFQAITVGRHYRVLSPSRPPEDPSYSEKKGGKDRRPSSQAGKRKASCHRGSPRK